MTLRKIQILVVAVVLSMFFPRFEPERQDRKKFVRHPGSKLDVLGLLDAVLFAALPRHLRGPAGTTLYLSRMRHDRQTWTRQVQPDQ